MNEGRGGRGKDISDGEGERERRGKWGREGGMGEEMSYVTR